MYAKKSAFDKDSLIAVYSRKSRDEGEDSLENHRIRLSEFIKQNEFSNVDWYEEVVSGGSINARPKFVELLNKVKASTYSAVLVIDLDRLSRGDTFERGTIERAFKESQTLIMTVKGEILDYSDKNEALTAGVKGLLANYELEQIKSRLKEGKKLAVQKGKPHSGIVPYGYYWDRNLREVVINEDERKLYRLMIKWYVEDNLSYNAITVRLNNSGYKSPRGKYWYPKVVKGILLNDFHLGYVTHGRMVSEPTGKLNSQGEMVWRHVENPNPDDVIIVKGNHTPIKTEEEHAQIVNRSITEKNRYANKSLDSGGLQFKLKGLVKCRHCGLVMPVIHNGKNKIKYVKKCDRVSKRRTDYCSNTRGINESILYEEVIDKLLQYRERLFEPIKVEEENSATAIENELDMLKKSSERIRKSIEKNKQMFEADIITIDELKTEIQKKEDEIKLIEAEISKLSKSSEYMKKTQSSERKKIWGSEEISNLLFNKKVYSDQEINYILKKVISHINYEITENKYLNIQIFYK